MACGGWEGGVDPGQLEARLRAGIEADRRYAAENSAKIRAIHSAPTYDEFRQLVLGKEMSVLMSVLCWNNKLFLYFCLKVVS